MRRPLIAGNWKMNGSLESNESLVNGVLGQLATVSHADMAICVPDVYLSQVAQLVGDSALGLGGQDCSVYEAGAYTGETSVVMLRELGCQFVIVGHSERRQYHGETDKLVAEKALAALAQGVTPIVCVGETQAEREADTTLEVIQKQVGELTSALTEEQLARVIVAYEPVWAIGTGLTATPEQAQEVHHFIRTLLGVVGQKIRILYGGSVKPANAAELFVKADIDGALVGGASLNADDFVAIAQAVNQ